MTAPADLLAPTHCHSAVAPEIADPRGERGRTDDIAARQVHVMFTHHITISLANSSPHLPSHQPRRLRHSRWWRATIWIPCILRLISSTG